MTAVPGLDVERLLGALRAIDEQTDDSPELTDAILGGPDEPIRREYAEAVAREYGPVTRGAGWVAWWTLADVYHAENESISDVAGHCNHDESPPECIASGQRIAAAYNAALSHIPGTAQEPVS